MPITPWVLRLIIANAAVYMLQRASPVIEQQLMLVPALIPSRPWTVITYMFLHQGLSHIFFNMLSLFFFGPRLEGQLGGSRFLVVYFVSGIAGGLLSFATPYAAIVGASGATLGVMVGYAYYWPQEQIYFWGVLPIRAWLFIIIMAALSLWAGFGGGGGDIAHFAHLGGIAGGYLTVRLFDARAASPARRAQSRRPPSLGRRDMERWSRIQRDKLHEVNRGEYDRIMDKIREQGAGSLTPDERNFLDNFSNRA
jgi:membrane associated rhomboid family serine protease